MIEPEVVITLGVDTHADFHVGAALDQLGRPVGTIEFPATRAGYDKFYDWANDQGRVEVAGVEGTGSWGTGLSRYLAERDVVCIEVNRPNRQQRRRHGKSDTADAVAAARAVQAQEATATPRGHNANAESLRMLRVASRSAIKARTQAINQLRAMIATGPEELVAPLRGGTKKLIVGTAASYRPAAGCFTPVTMAKTAMRSLAKRIKQLDAEIVELAAARNEIVARTAPVELMAMTGIGPAVAADLIITIGDNPDRISTEQAFASLCGVSPVDASSGRRQRHRLNRGGDRQANNALWTIVMVRLTCDQETKDYMTRQTAAGKTKREAIRQLKRYTARRIWRTLKTHPLTLDKP